MLLRAMPASEFLSTQRVVYTVLFRSNPLWEIWV